MKKIILAAAAISLACLSGSAFAVGSGGSVSVNSSHIGKVVGDVQITGTPSYERSLPNAGDFYGVVNIGNSVQQNAYRVGIQNLDLLSIANPETFGDSNLKEFTFYNVNTQYVPSFKYPATVKNITETTELKVDIEYTATNTGGLNILPR